MTYVVFFFRPTHLKLNRFAHRSHSIIFELKDLGILHVQKKLITMCETLLLLDFAQGEVTAETLSVPHFAGIPADVDSSSSAQNKLS